MSGNKVRRYLHTLKIALSGMIILILNQNCFKLSQQTLASTEESLVSTEFSSSCQFISVPTLRSILGQTLVLSQSDTAILDDNANVTNRMYISTYKSSLGEATDTNSEELSCSALKYKLASAIMINACVEAPESTIRRLFPMGVSDFTTLYLTFLGRNPTQGEVLTLRQLTSNVSTSQAPRAACAAVGASVEVLARNI